MSMTYAVFRVDDEGHLVRISYSRALGSGLRERNYIAQEEQLTHGDILLFPETDEFWLHDTTAWIRLDPFFENGSYTFGGQGWGPVLANQLRGAT